MEGIENVDDLGIFDQLPQRRMYEMYSRTLARQARDDDVLCLLRTGRSRTVVAFVLPPSEATADAVAEAKVHTVRISDLRESHLLSLLREQGNEVLAVTVGNYTDGHWVSTPAVYIVPFNAHWREVVSRWLETDCGDQNE